jgi:hypothetical protein
MKDIPIGFDIKFGDLEILSTSVISRDTNNCMLDNMEELEDNTDNCQSIAINMHIMNPMTSTASVTEIESDMSK